MFFIEFMSLKHFNPLPPHGGRPFPLSSLSMCIKISIHSLRMEGDINGQLLLVDLIEFQSTPSAWRETNHGTFI